LQSHRGVLATMAKNWVLSETAIIEQSHKSERVGVNRVADIRCVVPVWGFKKTI
jgi:hypothetical protein